MELLDLGVLKGQSDCDFIKNKKVFQIIIFVDYLK